MTGTPGRMDNKQWRQARAKAIRNAQGCQLCGGPLDPTAKRATPYATEVDHIVPLSEGGAPYAAWNLQAVHRRCHARKGTPEPPTRHAAVISPRADANNKPGQMCPCDRTSTGCEHLVSSGSW